MRESKEVLELILRETQLPWRLLIRYAKLSRSHPNALRIEVLRQVGEFVREWSESDLEALTVAYDLEELQARLGHRLHCSGADLELASKLAKLIQS